jgi:PAS domain S-box-containing protein
MLGADRLADKQGKESLELIFQHLETKESIINGISDALMLLDAKTYEILDVNQAFLNLYKVSFEQVFGKTCYEITHHLSKPCSQMFSDEPCPLKETVSTANFSNAEHVHKDRHGNNLYFEITSYPLKDVNGEVTRIIHLSRDVSERRRAEEDLKKKLTESEHLVALGQLVAEITHEIKNPLMMIGGFAQQLIQPVDEETKVKKLSIIIEQVARLEELIADLRKLYLSKALSNEPFKLKEVLDRVHSLVKDECLKKNIQAKLIIDENDLLVSGDPSKMEQVFLNVIKNSIEAMENGGNLSIEVKLSDERAEITICDDGCGIPKEHMDRILECFFTTKSYGTGLGLCISKKYIDEHEGSSISVDSEEGKGTTVKIGLPIYRRDSGDDGTKPPYGHQVG